MYWKYVRPILNSGSIAEFERMTGYSFPETFRTYATRYNGARPNHKKFVTKAGTERTMKRLLSFNSMDCESIWQGYYTEGLPSQCVPFAIDDFGNLICFDTTNNYIVFVNCETMAMEQVTDTFGKFLDLLTE